jgi:hypothetical protein
MQDSSNAPKIQILGIYQLSVTEELVEEQLHVLYGENFSEDTYYDARRNCEHQLRSTVLFEVLVSNCDEHFSMSDFIQPCESMPKENWQAAWAEAYLTIDGKELLVNRWCAPPKERNFRVAFFIHEYDPNQPLHTSYGQIACPTLDEMPERLKILVPYEIVD